MNATLEKAPNIPLPNLELLVTAISSTTRWRMLKELTCGEGRTIKELGKVGGVSYAAAAKHLAQLCRTGIVVCRRGHLYHIDKAFLPKAGEPFVDCGYCVLRLDAV